LAAVTVSVEDTPAATEVGFAEMLTVAGGVLTTFVAPLLTPQPVTPAKKSRATMEANEQKRVPPKRCVRMGCFM
jgi:hypothetical protein